MSQQVLNLKIRGLYTHPNDLSEVPEGALAVADNIVIDRESLASPRRGFDRLTYNYATVSDRADRLIPYQSKLLSRRTGDILSWYDNSSGWTDLAGFTASHPDSSTARLRAVEANSNLYLTTAAGVYVTSAYNVAPRLSGQPKALDVVGSNAGSSGFQADNTQVAYRILWGRKDANQNLILGAPSQRALVSNAAGGTRDVSLTITIPSGIAVTDFVQVYRSAQSSGSSIEPNDELQLVYEANPTSGEISAKSLTFTDSTTDALRGASLYTSPSQEGLINSNEALPLAKDMTVYKGMAIYANTTTKHRLNITLLATGGSSGLAANDTLVIAGTTYTGKTSETASSGYFKVFTSGSVSQNIADTANSLVRVINQYATNTLVYAMYESGYGDLPGQILIEERAIGGSSFAMTASAHGTAYNPALPTSGTTVSSSNDTFQNGIYVSKLQQPEAVPLDQQFFIGSASKKILRCLALRDSAFILKEDGIYRVLGESPTSITVQLLDNTAILIAPDSACVLNNTIYALTTQGVVAISDTGVQVVSRAIEVSLTALIGVNYTVLQTKSFGVAYESERKYMISVPSAASDTYPTQTYVYNLFTNAWTRWTLAKGAGIVNPIEDKLYFANADNRYIVQERKTYSFRDFIDEGDTYTISAVSGRTLTISGGVSGINVGDLVYQSESLNAQVTAKHEGAHTLTMSATVVFATGSATVYQGVNANMSWNSQSAQNPGVLKHYGSCSFLLKNRNFRLAAAGFSTEISGSTTQTTLYGAPGSLWGLFQWGDVPWGGAATAKPIRTLVPLEKARCSQLTVSWQCYCAYSQFIMAGVSLEFSSTTQDLVR